MITLGQPLRANRLPSELLSAAEIGAAVLDGELVRFGDEVAPIDLPLTAERRARGFGHAVRDSRVILSDRSAAWVWGWIPLAPRISTSVSITARVPSPDRRRLHAREVVIGTDEITRLAGVAVTTPLRTLIDIARHDTAADVVEVLARGMLEHSIRAATVTAVLDQRTRLAYVRRARERIIAAAAIAEISRC